MSNQKEILEELLLRNTTVSIIESMTIQLKLFLSFPIDKIQTKLNFDQAAA